MGCSIYVSLVGRTVEAAPTTPPVAGGRGVLCVVSGYPLPSVAEALGHHGIYDQQVSGNASTVSEIMVATLCNAEKVPSVLLSFSELA